MAKRTGVYGHTSLETAYMIEDYPYGRLRCKRRVWLEHTPKRGYRFVAQTENPKNGRWNAPHKGTYSEVAACLYLDENNHVQPAGINPYTDAAAALAFAQDFGSNCYGADDFRTWAFKKALYERKCANGEIGFFINGEKQAPNETDTARHVRDAELWSEVVRLLGGS